MKLLRNIAPILILLFPLLASHSAQAQASIYATAALTGYGTTTEYNSDIYFKKATGGIIAGVFYNFPIQSRLTAGADLRASYSPGSRGGTFETAALRIGFVPKRIRLRPYFLLGGGVVSTTSGDGSIFYNSASGTFSYPSNRITTGAAELAFGLDIRLTDSFDLRALEYGAATGPTAAAAFVNSGLVYHFHSAPHPRKS